MNAHTITVHYTLAGAEVMSLINKDENKTFGAVFRTPVDNSKGIPHILEHSVLCGSKKYPIKEPFVELMKGSLNTFLNAFTYPDRTCYPVASTNLQVQGGCGMMSSLQCDPHARLLHAVSCCLLDWLVLPQDFYNLVDVYLDAVLYPNCVRDPKTFAQEGWHYELENPEVSQSASLPSNAGFHCVQSLQSASGYRACVSYLALFQMSSQLGMLCRMS